MNIKLAISEFFAALFSKKIQPELADINAKLQLIEETNDLIVKKIVILENYVNLLIMLNPHIKLSARDASMEDEDESISENVDSISKRILN